MPEVKKTTRRRRDPDNTRSAILDAASTLLAKNGPEGLSVSQVAQLAKVNRGTAYQHFQTREQLLEATTAWVSEKLSRAVFGDGGSADGTGMMDPREVAEHLAVFAMENPELGRAWMFEVLNSNRPSGDPFWNQYKTRLEEFARSEYAQPGIDVEVHSVMVLVGAFLWPVWARAHTRTAKERREMAQRYSREALRLAMHGSMRPDKFPQLDAKLRKSGRDS
ncbi:MAG TPA: TetR/AcrR family transcriptional regulator [Nevskia sp.]|nr:TetR/AcrR family transcriptional regulator [Nevskia sp.]